MEKYVIRFIGYDASESLAKADGIITPSGIFEKFKSTSGYGGTRHWVECNKDLLAKREKEAFQNYKRGGWTAFLLRSVDNGNGKWEDTDLAKRFLNAFFKTVRSGDPNAHVQCKADEFEEYLNDFGINRTTFWNPSNEHKPRVIAATNANLLVAAEILGQFFFLPLPSITKGLNDVISLVTKCTEAVLEYKRRNDLYLPGWVEEIEFQSESRLRNEISTLEQNIVQRRSELAKWRRYKGTLSASGKTLNSLVVEIFRDFFNLDVRSEEQFIDDAVILVGNKPLFIVEIKGVNGGLKREHVNQVDSHRERLGLSPDVAGLLVINDFSDVEGLADRKAKTFDAQQLSRAQQDNIKILRTSMLLELLQILETTTARQGKFIELCLAGKPIVELPSAEGTLK